MQRFGYGVGCLCLGLLLSLPSEAKAKAINKSFHEVFEVRPGAILHLDHGDGDVIIEPWEQDAVDVQVTYRADFKGLGFNTERDFTVDFKQDDNEIHVVGRETNVRISVGIHASRRFDYTYKIRGPRYLDLDLDGEDGDVAIKEWTGKIECRLEDGDLMLQDLATPSVQLYLDDGDLTMQRFDGTLVATLEDGDVRITECRLDSGRIKVEDGDVAISHCAGEFEISSEDGDLMLDEVHSKKIELSTQDGDIRVDLISVAAVDLDLQTQDGDVTVAIQEGLSASYSIQTDDGEISLELPGAANAFKTRKAASGTLLDGDGNLSIISRDGNVALRQHSS